MNGKYQEHEVNWHENSGRTKSGKIAECIANYNIKKEYEMLQDQEDAGKIAPEMGQATCGMRW
jgi:hypothetical protein